MKGDLFMTESKIINLNYMDMPINTVNNLKKYTIIDFEYVEANRKGKKEQDICNIAAIFVENGKVTDVLNEWTVPLNVTSVGLVSLHTKLKAINYHFESKDMKASRHNYQEFFRRSFRWLGRYKIITNPIIGWGVNTDVASYNDLVKSLFNEEPIESKVVPLIIQDSQNCFSNILGTQSIGLGNMCKLLNVDYKSDHIGLYDVKRINELMVKYRSKILS